MTDTNTQQLPPGMNAPRGPVPGKIEPTEPQKPPIPPVDPNNHPLFTGDAPKPADKPAAKQEPPKETPPELVPLAGEVGEAFTDLKDDPHTAPGALYIERMCSTKGVDLQRAFGKAVDKGDLSLIDDAYLQEKLGADAEYVKQQASALFTYVQDKVMASVNSMYASVGDGDKAAGQQILEQAAKYFNSAASKEDRAEISLLLNSGDPNLMTKAAKRVVEFARSKGAVVQPGNTNVYSPNSERGLSAEEYRKAIANPKLSDAEYAKLRQQRVLGKKQGL